MKNGGGGEISHFVIIIIVIVVLILTSGQLTIIVNCQIIVNSKKIRIHFYVTIKSMLIRDIFLSHLCIF